jgi:hypothetical protein
MYILANTQGKNISYKNILSQIFNRDSSFNARMHLEIAGAVFSLEKLRGSHVN